MQKEAQLPLPVLRHPVAEGADPLGNVSVLLAQAVLQGETGRTGAPRKVLARGLHHPGGRDVGSGQALDALEHGPGGQKDFLLVKLADGILGLILDVPEDHVLQLGE